MEENLKKNTYMCIYRYTHKYNWITLLFTRNIVNQLYFNWQKRNHHHHQQKKRVWWDFLCGFVWGAVLPCLYLQPCFPAQDRNPHWRHILEAIPPALRTVSHALVYSPLLEILSWRDRRPRWLLGGILQGATLGAVTVMFISGEADIRIRERPCPFCWLGFRFLAPGAFWGLATSLVFCEMSWTHQSVTPVSLKEVQIGMLFAVKERWWSRLCFSFVFFSARRCAECVWCVRLKWIVRCYLLVCGRVRGPAAESAQNSGQRWVCLVGGAGCSAWTVRWEPRCRLREWSDLSSVGRVVSVGAGGGWRAGGSRALRVSRCGLCPGDQESWAGSWCGGGLYVLSCSCRYF